MSVEQMTRNLNHGVLIFRDGGGSAMKTLVIPVEVGNLKWTQTTDSKRINHRKDLLPFAEGRDVPMEVSFTIGFVNYMADPSDSSTESPMDVLDHTANAADWQSVEDWGVFAIDLEFRIRSPNPDIDKHEILVFENFHKTKADIEEDEDFDKIAVSGMCRATRPTSTRLTDAQWNALTY